MTMHTTIAIMFGGRSCEHQVSVNSARSVLASIDKKRYQTVLIGIDSDGAWHLSDSTDIEELLEQGCVSKTKGTSVVLDFASPGCFIATTEVLNQRPAIDVFFPVLHGTYGEDGTVQGLLEMNNVAYVGCGVAASANGMDKVIAKQLFSLAGIPQNPHQIVGYSAWLDDQEQLLAQIEQSLDYPLFVKPASMGSSVGITKAQDRTSLLNAVNEALLYDDKILVEVAFDNGSEVECAVLGNTSPQVSVVGEIEAGAEFYDYAAKYVDDSSEVTIPAPISASSAQLVQEYALQAFKAIDGAGLARVDFFVGKKDGRVVINEINTMPGFTPISMYPMLWKASDLPYDQLIDRLISLAVDRHSRKERLRTVF